MGNLNQYEATVARMDSYMPAVCVKLDVTVITSSRTHRPIKSHHAIFIAYFLHQTFSPPTTSLSPSQFSPAQSFQFSSSCILSTDDF